MQLLQRLSVSILWVLAAVGVACALVWAATAAGMIKPLVVISGSMEPEITTGDLLIATPAPADALRVGDVVSLPSSLTDNLVTHRIEQIVPREDGGWTISMKGDNNAHPDILDYTVADSVWKPALQLSGWGATLARVTTPAVAVPLVIGLAGLLGLALMTPAEPRRAPAHTSRSARRARAAPVMRRALLGAAALAVVVAGVLAAAVAPSTAAATIVPITFDLGPVLPGQSQSAQESFTIPLRATVVEASWIAQEGGADWSAAVCGKAACTPLHELVGDVLDAGEHRLSVTVEMPAGAHPAETVSARGALRLVEAEGELPATGGAAPWIVLVAGAAIAGAGGILLLTRRRAEEDA